MRSASIVGTALIITAVVIVVGLVGTLVVNWINP